MSKHDLESICFVYCIDQVKNTYTEFELQGISYDETKTSKKYSTEAKPETKKSDFLFSLSSDNQQASVS